MDREQIKTVLPHREPMLLVDEAYLDETGVAHGSYTVRGDEWFLQGHFPGNPVTPGVIQLEIMAQSCALLLSEQTAGGVAYYAGIENVRFRRKVRPGDVMEVQGILTKSKGSFYFIHARARVGAELCCQGDLIFAVEKER
ncbi:MAG: 3-hydroxyacyl-ACP dehydratase FabZ [Firmicutes bacterium]|nr:3-hydroxyacyl-ACP dehydratase FabZ [Bacillota bacterium]